MRIMELVVLSNNESWCTLIFHVYVSGSIDLIYFDMPCVLKTVYATTEIKDYDDIGKPFFTKLQNNFT